MAASRITSLITSTAPLHKQLLQSSKPTERKLQTSMP
jgi:hypothetical protein